jgi:hypothetical protein
MSAASARDLIDKVLWLVVVVLVWPTCATAQIQQAQVPSSGVSVATIGKFVGGAALGLGMHEAGHIAFDVLFDAQPGFGKVHFAGIPFFAITHRPMPPAREFAISSAGFWVQHLSSEVLLTRHPDLKTLRMPLHKGLLAFNTVASVAYAGAAFARYGPVERDTLGMALAADVDERWIGALVLTPALLDASRYYKPESRWLRWASRGTKAASAVLILKAASSK